MKLTQDLDQGLIYMLSFKYEKIVFKRAMEILIESNFSYTGFLPHDEGSYYNRNRESVLVDFKHDNSVMVMRKINSVGLITQGNRVTFGNGHTYLAHHAEQIENEFLINIYANSKPGDLLYLYSDKALIKTIDGVLKISIIEP